MTAIPHTPGHIRFPEIDILRSLMIFGMVFFHFSYIFSDMGFFDIALYEGFWWIFPRVVAAGFITLMGTSLTISYNRACARVEGKQLFYKFLRRGSVLLAIGLGITVVTRFLFAGNFVLFGILHLIGLSIIIAFPLLPFKWMNLLLGLAVWGGGLWLGTFRFDFYALLWLGFRPASYYPVDYLPLLPWFAFTCWGICLGNWLYPGGERGFSLPAFAGDHFLLRLISFPGRHSLPIYLIHLPVLYGAGWLCIILFRG